MAGKKERLREDYEKSAEFYDSRYKDIQFEKYSIMLSKIALTQENPAGFSAPRKLPKQFSWEEPILDLGCGTGLLQEFIPDKKIFGCDFSEKMLERAKERGEVTKVADLNKKLPYEDDSFATILSFTVLQNVENVDNFLKEVKRCLKMSGIFVLTTLKKTTNEKQLIKLIEKYFAIQELTDCGEDVGFVLNPKL